MYLLRYIEESVSVTANTASVLVQQIRNVDLNRLILCAHLITVPPSDSIHREVVTKAPDQSKYKGCVYMLNASDRYRQGNCAYARRVRIFIHNIDNDYSPTIEPVAMCKYVMKGEPAWADCVFDSLIQGRNENHHA